MTTGTTHQFQNVFSELQRYGFLLESDPKLPSVCSIVAGEPMRGSWWSHPKANLIFNVNEKLEDDELVLITKLVSGKVTFVHRDLWPQLFAIGNAAESWQLAKLSAAAKDLFAIVERYGSIRTDEISWEYKIKVGDAARELEKRLLIVAGQVHTESGAHAKVLQTWKSWKAKVALRSSSMSVERARLDLEDRLRRLNNEFHAKATLPWQ